MALISNPKLLLFTSNLLVGLVVSVGGGFGLNHGLLVGREGKFSLLREGEDLGFGVLVGGSEVAIRRFSAALAFKKTGQPR